MLARKIPSAAAPSPTCNVCEGELVPIPTLSVLKYKGVASSSPVFTCTAFALAPACVLPLSPSSFNKLVYVEAIVFPV